jgi:Zn-dependent membrane protease YugP
MGAYFIWILPPMLLGMWAQYKVKSAFAAGQRIPASSGLSGAETAQAILDSNGITGVRIEETPGNLSDHYDPRGKVLRLSSAVFHGRSLASLGVAAHEVGHAIQDAKRYTPLVLRNGIVPLASIGSKAFIFLIIAGGILQFYGLILLGIALFSLTVIFQLVNLPVEFDASSRARNILTSQGIITQEEDKTVKRVLNAAAMTYVAATITSIATLMYYLSAYGRRD